LLPACAHAFVDPVHEQILDRVAGQVPAAEGFVFFPEAIRQLGDCALGKQTISRRLGKGRLDVAGGEAPGVHLHRQLLKHFRVFAQEGQQTGAVGLLTAADLGRRHFEAPLGCLQDRGLVAVAIALPGRLPPLVAAPTDKIGLLLLEGFLEDQAGGETDQFPGGISFGGPQPGRQQCRQFLLQTVRRCYSLHGAFSPLLAGLPT
jgi:hypothetical protein